MYAQDVARDMYHFWLGQRLGDCLAKGCLIFTGMEQSVGPLEKASGESDARRAVMTRKVLLKVSDWLYGPRNGNGDRGTVELLYAAQPAISKTGIGPWLPWEGVNLQVGGQLLVVRWAKDAPRPVWGGEPEDVALVTSETSLFAPIGEVIAQQRRFERDPSLAANIPRSLRDRPDVLFQGYLLKYLTDVEGPRNVDQAAVMLSGLMRFDPMPGSGREAIALWLTTTFYRFTAATRAAVTEAVTASATADDVRIADPAMATLIRLSDLRMLDIEPFLTPAVQRKMVENYQAYRLRNPREPAHPEFESQLGLR